MIETNYKILIVEDNKRQLDTYVEILSGHGEIVTCSSGEDAIEVMDDKLAVIVTDLMLSGEINGLEVLKNALIKLPDTPVILVTGHATVETALEAMRSGAYDYLVKPIDIQRLRILVDKAIERYSIASERNKLLRAIEEETLFMGMVGNSEEMQDVFRKLTAVGPTYATVLIMGESGTGKELAADAIHKLSKRNGEIIKLNCSAIPEHLLESELFGYEKGAFTGATKRKPGKFELANDGTLFLDEIGDMPLTLQSKLLRVLETGIVELLGSTTPIKIDVRIISATNQDLLKLINSGKFRHDLYYRLRVFLLEIPPLREHPDDIPLFISYFLKQISAKLGKDLSGISPKVLKTLKSYEWPGNIRQLRNALEEMAILSQNDIIDILPSFIDENTIRPKISGKTMDEIEHEAIVQALGKTDGNRTKAAKLLGIGLRTLYRKIDKYGIE